jgi:predicted ATPase/class 3 adenylate cyclase
LIHNRAVPPLERQRVSEPSPPVAFLFSDIEGSTRLWEQEPQRMGPALARHDALARSIVEQHDGRVVKKTGDGLHAAFDQPLAALNAVLQLQLALADPAATAGLALHLRCGLHVGGDELRDGDFYGPAVNRAARIMNAAHGGQVLLSDALAALVQGRLPPDTLLRDLGQVRLRDLTRPERLHQLVHPRLRAQFPPLRSLEATPNNLPQQLNSFVGRERELAQARQALGRSRLLTLLGMGGIGKSRLSVQLGAEVMDDYPDGVWLVELAPLADPRLVPQAAASVLGVKEEAGQDVLDALLRHVRDKQLLFILDNCEHVLHACALLAKQLLQAGAGVRVLASSRDVLQVAGEASYPVPTLSVPDPQRLPAPERLVELEAVRLFVDRATASQPAFRVTAANAAAVADICHRLDGIPLAIELAAARTRALSVEAIAARLGDRFRLLVSGDRTVLPRQRTLRALIDWSYDLLPEPERALLRRLSVFAGGWTAEAAEHVGWSEGQDAADLLDLLTHLVEKSLVMMDADGARYRMLDTVRHYAQERFREAGAPAEAHERHLGFYLQLAEQARAGLQGPQQGHWLGRLDQERENLLAAHAWCSSHGGDAACRQGLRLVFALRPYWLNRGLLGLGYAVTVEALQREGARGRDEWRFRGLSDAGWLAYFLGRYAQSRQYLQEGLDIAREAGNTAWIAGVLQPLGMACLGDGDAAAARGHLQEAVELARRLGNPRELAAALNALAQLHRTQGEPEVALPLYQQVLALAREMGNQEYIAAFLLNLAMVSAGRRPWDELRAMLLETLDIAAAIGSKPAGQSALEVCAGLAATRDDWPRAARFYGVAEEQAAQTGLQRDPADAAFLLPLIQRAREALGTAEFDALQAQGRALAVDDALLQARAWLGN